MTSDEAIYADLPEDGLEDIYADLEDELNKAGYDPALMLDQPIAPALPFRKETATQSPQHSKETKTSKKPKKEKAKAASGVSAQKKKLPPSTSQRPAGGKQNPHIRTGTGTGLLIPTDVLSQRRLLKKVERIEPRKFEAEEGKVDFRGYLRKVNPEEKVEKAPPPAIKKKPSISSIDTDPGKIRYRRLPLSRVDLSNPPTVNRDKKPRLSIDIQDNDDIAYDEDVYDDVTNIVDQDVYDDVTNIVDQDLYDDVTNVIDQDVYDDVENMSVQQNGDHVDQDVYDDVENLADKGNSQDIYDDLENQNPDMAGELYDDVESVGITRKADSPSDTYDDVCSPSTGQKMGQSEDLYDEVPDGLANQKEQISPGKKLSTAQEKKRKTEELKVRKKQIEQEKKRQKELEKYTKEMEKKRKVFMEYYNIRESDKPLMVAQVSSTNDLRGKQNLEVEIGDVVHVLCKEHKKMPKGAWLAERSDRSAIGFIAPGILNQNMLSTFDDNY